MQGRQANATATVLCSDLVGSTELMSSPGEARFDDFRRRHFDNLRGCLTRHGGEAADGPRPPRPVDRAGEGGAAAARALPRRVRHRGGRGGPAGAGDAGGRLPPDRQVPGGVVPGGRHGPVRLLETVRQYADERLQAAGEAEQTRRPGRYGPGRPRVGVRGRLRGVALRTRCSRAPRPAAGRCWTTGPLAAYRRRLAEIDAAEKTVDGGLLEKLDAERRALVAELRTAAGRRAPHRGRPARARGAPRPLARDGGVLPLPAARAPDLDS